MFNLVFVLASVAGAVGCGGATCHPPAQATYACATAAPGAPGCKGIPVSAGGSAREADETFAVGCMVELPECLGAYPDEVASCTCEAPGGGSGAPAWVCPA